MHSYSTCPVCLSPNFKEVLRAKDHTVSGETFGIVHCDNCTHRFTHPVPDAAHIGPYYQSEDYISHSNTSKGFINAAYQRVRKITLKQKRNLLNDFTGMQQGKILDIGCGTGAFLGTVKEAGWNVTGVEPDPGARKLAKELWNIEAHPGESFYELEEGKYDAASMWHVLEHVHELEQYMEKIHRLLKPNGKFIVAVPNYTSWDAQKYGAAWAAYDVPRHLYHFSPASMQHLVERKGFRLKEIKRMPFDSFYVAMLSERYKNGSMIKAIWNGFCSWWVALGKKDRCSSIIYLLEK